MHASPSLKQFGASSDPISDVVTINSSAPDSVPSIDDDSQLPHILHAEPDVDVTMGLPSPTDAAPTLDTSVDQPNSKTSPDMPAISDLAVQTPENNNMDASPSDTSAVTRPPPDDEDDTDRPPAKRPRRLSDPDRASLVHVRPTLCFLFFHFTSYIIQCFAFFRLPMVQRMA